MDLKKTRDILDGNIVSTSTCMCACIYGVPSPPHSTGVVLATQTADSQSSSLPGIIAPWSSEINLD